MQYPRKENELNFLEKLRNLSSGLSFFFQLVCYIYVYSTRHI